MRVAHYQGKKKMLKFVIETLKGVLWSDLTFSGFADSHAFAAVLFSKIFIYVHTKRNNEIQGIY